MWLANFSKSGTLGLLIDSFFTFDDLRTSHLATSHTPLFPSLVPAQ